MGAVWMSRLNKSANTKKSTGEIKDRRLVVVVGVGFQKHSARVSLTGGRCTVCRYTRLWH